VKLLIDLLKKERFFFINKKICLIDIKEKIDVKISYNELLDTYKNLYMDLTEEEVINKLPQIGDTIPVYVSAVNSKDGSFYISIKKAYEELALKEINYVLENRTKIKCLIKSLNDNGYIAVYKGVSIFITLNKIIGEEWNKENIINTWKEIYIIRKEDKTKIPFLGMYINNNDISIAIPVDQFIVGMTLEGKIIHISEGGIFLNINGYLGFAKHLDCTWVIGSNLNDLFYVGQIVQGKLLHLKNYQILCGIRQLQTEKINTLKEKYKEGLIYDVVIKSVRAHDLYVSLDDSITVNIGVKHITWNEAIDLKSLYSVGQKIKAKILEWDQELILSIKACRENYFQQVVNDLKKNSEIENVPVISISGHRIFIRIHPEVSGIIEQKDLNWVNNEAINTVEKIKEALIKNEEFKFPKVKLLNIDEDLERIQLSVKHLYSDPINVLLETYGKGTFIKGIIEQIINTQDRRGVIVSTEKEKNSIFIPETHLHRNQENCKIGRFTLGMEVSFKIYGADRKHSILLGSIKHAMEKKQKKQSNYNTKMGTIGDSL